MFWTVLLVYAIYLALGCALQRKMIYPRGLAQPDPTPGADIAALDKSTIETDDAKVELWFVTGHGVSPQKPGPAVLFAHGNAELIDDQKIIIDGYRRLGVSVMLCEYRGYGRSTGKPTQKGIVADHITAYDRLIYLPEVDRQRIIFHGRSLGSGVLCAAALQRAPAAMILRSPFISVSNFAARFLIPPLFVVDPYDNAAALQKLHTPTLILHGRSDSIIPIRHSRKLHALDPDSTLIEYDQGHNDFPIDSPKFWADIEGFLRQHEILR